MNRFIKNFFFPTLQNNLKPHSLSFGTFATVVGLTVLLEILFCIYTLVFKINMANQAGSTTIQAGAIESANEAFREVILFSNSLIGNILLALLAYVFLVLVIPMTVAYFRHRSNVVSIKIRETGILFKESLHWAKWTVGWEIILFIFYYLLSTQIFL